MSRLVERVCAELVVQSGLPDSSMGEIPVYSNDGVANVWGFKKNPSDANFIMVIGKIDGEIELDAQAATTATHHVGIRQLCHYIKSCTTSSDPTPFEGQCVELNDEDSGIAISGIVLGGAAIGMGSLSGIVLAADSLILGALIIFGTVAIGVAMIGFGIGIYNNINN